MSFLRWALGLFGYQFLQPLKVGTRLIDRHGQWWVFIEAKSNSYRYELCRNEFVHITRRWLFTETKWLPLLNVRHWTVVKEGEEK